MNLRDFRLQTQGLSEPKLFKRRVRSVGDPVFDLEAEAVGDAVGIRVIGDDFGDVEDVPVAEAGFAQRVDVGVVGCGWAFGEFHGETQHGGALGGQRGGGPVVLDGRYKFVVFDESAQTTPVVDYSIVAVIGEADDQGDEFAFDLAQRGGAAHGRFVEALVCCHAAGFNEWTAKMLSTRPHVGSTTRGYSSASSPSQSLSGMTVIRAMPHLATLPVVS